MYLDRLIQPDEMHEFAAQLQEHHKATTADGSSILDRAMREHNLVRVAHCS
jgi:COP9 signalosome complex subunit 4